MTKNQDDAGAGDVFTMKLDELERRVSRASELIAEAEALLPGLRPLDAASRKFSIGRLRHGEDEALLAIFDAAEAHHGSFQALVTKGDAVFETVPARAALARRSLLGGVGGRIHKLSRLLRDAEIRLGAKAKEIGIAAHAIGRASAAADEPLRAAIASADAFYEGANAGTSRRTKKTT